jgi:Tol biopolymer transport system component
MSSPFRWIIPVVAIGLIAAAAAAWGIAINRQPSLGRQAIFVTNVASGTTTVWRSAADRDLWAPDWSPDGTMIAWHETFAADAPADLFVANRDGTATRRVVGGSHAAWSPDGRRLAFEGQLDEPGNFDIYVIDLGSGATRRLTHDPALDWAPSWSPDARSIGFTSRRTGSDQLYVLDLESAPADRAVTSGPGSAVRLQWSPDGTRIAFGSDRTGDAEIYAADADGANVVALTDNTAADWDPAWSPDGRRIAFLSYRDGQAAIYTMDVDGTNQVRLTRDASMEATGGFEWSPDGMSIVYSAAVRGG